MCIHIGEKLNHSVVPQTDFWQPFSPDDEDKGRCLLLFSTGRQKLFHYVLITTSKHNLPQELYKITWLLRNVTLKCIKIKTVVGGTS